MGMNDLKNLLVPMPCQQHDTHGLHTAPGGTCHGTQKHADQQGKLCKGGPGFIIRSDKTGGGDDRTHLKGGVTEGLGNGTVNRAIDIDGDQDDKNRHQYKETPALCIFPKYPQIPFYQLVMKRKIDPGQEHEKNKNEIKINAFVVGDTHVFY